MVHYEIAVANYLCYLLHIIHPQEQPFSATHGIFSSGNGRSRDLLSFSRSLASGFRISRDICGRTNCTSTCSQPKPLVFDSHPAESIVDRNQNAFFIGTSGSGLLTMRQACVEESLALHNPNLTVNVLFVDVSINKSVVVLQQLKEKYNNIRLVSINLDEYLAGTVLYERQFSRLNNRLK